MGATSRARRAVILVALAGGLFTAGAAPAMAATLPAHATAAAPAKATAKPAPVPPAGVAVGKANVAKPRGIGGGVHLNPTINWSVSLSASPFFLWPTQFSTLTATASSDVGPTPFYIYILDQNTQTVVARCGTGTTCSVAVTSPTPAVHNYVAYISDLTDVNGNHEIAISSSITVDWMGVSMMLAASPHTLAVGNTSMLTETSASDIGPTPFFVQLWDTTTGTLLTTCGTGTVCQVGVSQSVATTHSYVATFGANSPTFPPAELQSTTATNYITWVGSGLQISLTAPGVTINGPETVTATASIDVGPTPYFIEVFNENGTRIATCASGSTCSFIYQPAGPPSGSNLVAFISSFDSTLLPSNIQATSNTVTTVSENIT